MNDKNMPGSQMIGGRTYRNVPTTNNTEPQRPAYPAIRKPGTGPIITTADVEPKKSTEDILREVDMAYAAKSVEKVNADFEADAKVKEKKGKK
jgi:hypothetical protein